MHFNFKLPLIILILVAAALIYFYFVPYVRHLLHQKTKARYEALKDSTLPWQIIGKSERGRPVYLLDIGQGEHPTVIFGAFHGDEQAGFHLVCQLADTLYAQPQLIHKRVLLVPVVNPDGLLNRTRFNANKVDINRNFPTANWSPVARKKRYFPGRQPGSEAETQLVMWLLEKYHPARIISIHDALKMNNFNGPAERLATLLAGYNHYPVTADVGYPTPGSFGNYAGVEHHIPTVTLELPDVGPQEAWQQNGPALIAAINMDNDSVGVKR